jgi:D-alanyl-D-alanine carboxypeptidase
MPRLVTRRDVMVGGGLGLAGLALAACGTTRISPVERGPGTTNGTTGTTGAAGTARSGTTVAGGDPPTLDAATTARLDQLLDAGMAASGLPGVDVGVWIGDQEWRRQRGVGDLTFKLPYPADNAARIAGITKTFTSTAVLQLVDQRKLALDDELETYVPGIANGNRITVHDLLGMTSGIYDYAADPSFVSRLSADPTMAWTDDDTLAIIKAHPADFAPGDKVVSSDSNYALLGMILAKVAAQPVAQVIATQVLDRLGLTHTTYPTTSAMPMPHPTAYEPNPSPAGAASPYPFTNTPTPKAVNEVNPALAGAAGAMVSTVPDLRTWAKELTDGTLLSPASQQARLQTKPMAGQAVARYGLGIMSIGELLGHTGAMLGTNSVVFRLPSADATFVAVGNESTNVTTATTDLIVVPMMQALFPAQFT